MLDKNTIELVLQEALSTGGDFSEIFVEDRFNNNISLTGGKIETSLSGRSFGIGIRIFKGVFCVYGYTNDSSREALIKCASEAAAAIKGTTTDIKLNLIKQDIANYNKIELLPTSVEKHRKIEVMKEMYETMRGFDSSISQAKVNYLDTTQNILVANSEGLLVEDRRVRTRISAEAIASSGARMESGRATLGESRGFEMLDSELLKAKSLSAAESAKIALSAELCPGGQMPVVIDNGFGGVIFHEACGHGLEATSVSKGTSVFSNKVGQQIANPKITAIDDGTIENAWGTLNVDDEGTPTKKNILIENGILKSYLIDKLGGRKMGMESTGSGRRQSYKFAPTSRMNNTYIAGGSDKLEDMISSIDYGIYAKHMGGGSVNPATGEFNFAVTEGYLVKDGKILHPVKGATLIGSGPDILNKIDMVGDNLDHAPGMCGSISGSIPTNVGQPAVRVSNITVGGQK